MIDFETESFKLIETIRLKSSEIIYHGDITTLKDNDLKKLLFFNGGLKKTLRLSKSGYDIIQQIMESWTIEMPKNFEVKGKHLLALDANLTGFWYLDKKSITLFSTDDAVLLKMIDADFDLFDGLR